MLTLVTRERLEFLFVDRSCVDEGARRDSTPQSVAQTVRHRMIDDRVARPGGATRMRNKIWNTARERRRDGKATRIRVILHVILRRVRQYNRRTYGPNDTGQPTQQRNRIDDLEVV